KWSMEHLVAKAPRPVMPGDADGESKRQPEMPRSPRDPIAQSQHTRRLAGDGTLVRRRSRAQVRLHAERAVEARYGLSRDAQRDRFLRLDRTSRIVGPPVREHERPQEGGLGQLRPAERGREVDAAARVGVDPRDTRPQDVGGAGAHPSGNAATRGVDTRYPLLSAFGVPR